MTAGGRPGPAVHCRWRRTGPGSGAGQLVTVS